MATDLNQYSSDVGEVIGGGATYRKTGGYRLDSTGTQHGMAKTVQTIAATSVRTLNATPISIIAAPGAGYAVIPKVIEIFLDYGTAAYDSVDSGDDLEIRYTDGSGSLIATIEATGLMNATSDQVRIVIPSGTITPVANAAVVITLGTGEVYSAAGDSPLKVVVHEYDIIKLAV